MAKKRERLAMFSVGAQWNPLQAQLRELLGDKDSFDQAMALLLRMHALLHAREVSGSREQTVMDMVWEGLTDDAFQTMPTPEDVTVAWNIWHVTRIEDLTANLLIADGDQVLGGDWQARLHTAVRDTGNAMTDPEILSFSNEVDRNVLKEYRNAVGARTREIITSLGPKDLARKFLKRQTDRIIEEGGLTSHPDSIWLRDFWGRKNVAGILLMPITRHQMGHLNDCLKLKVKCSTQAARKGTAV
jgi:hypothetical protein